MKYLIDNTHPNGGSQNSPEYSTSFLHDWRQDVKDHAITNIKDVMFYSALGATAGLVFSTALDAVTIESTPRKQKVANFLINKKKHDALFLPVFITPAKVDIFMSSFILATQIKDGNCITYKTAGALHPGLSDQVENSNTVQEIAAKGKPKRTLELGGLYAIPIAIKMISSSYRRTATKTIAI